MPNSFIVEEVKASSATVSVFGAKKNPDVILYKATAEGSGNRHDCRVTRETVPLQCKLIGLKPATLYTISMRSCLSGDRCGDALTLEVDTTLPGIFSYDFHGA